MKFNIKEVISSVFKKALLLRLPFFTNHVLIVRLDFVGDYILFRNGIDAIRSSERFKNYKFTLLGNIAFKDLAEKYDGDKFDHFIWIDPKTLNDNLKKTSLIFKLKLKTYRTIINPTFTINLTNDLFIKYINAKESIGTSKNNEVTSFPYFELQKPEFETCYTELIEVPDNSNFEFFRNIKFIERLTHSDNIPIKFELPVKSIEQTINLQPPKLIIVPGASKEYRRWSTLNFANLIKKVYTVYGDKFIIYLTGSKGEIELGEQICNYIINENIKIVNLIGKTTIIETIELISKSIGVVSNETGTVHIAAALNVPAVCISNGNDFGRFNPYPLSLSNNITTIYPNETFDQEDLFYYNVKAYVGSSLNINEITVDRVFESTKKLLNRI